MNTLNDKEVVKMILEKYHNFSQHPDVLSIHPKNTGMREVKQIELALESMQEIREQYKGTLYTMIIGLTTRELG